MPNLFRDAALVAGEEFKRNIRRTGYRIITLAVPVLLLLATLLIPVARDLLESDEPPTPDGFVDNAGVINRQVAENTPGLVGYESVAGGRAALLSDDIENLFVVPGDYLDSGEVQWLRQESGIFEDDQSLSQFRSLLTVGLIAGQVEPELLQRVLTPIRFERVRVTEEGAEEDFEAEDVVRVVVVVGMAMILFFSVAFGTGYMIQALTDEKENRMIEILATSLSPLEIMAGKIAGVAAVTFLQMGIWVGSVLILGPRAFQQLDESLDLSVGADMYLVTVLFFVAAFFLAIGLAAIVSAITTSVREASQIGGIIVLPFVVPLWLLTALLEHPDGMVSRVMTFIPFTAPITTVARVAIGDPPVVEVAGSLLIVLSSAAVAMWVAARVFRVGMLLFGQRMSLRAIARAVRYSG